MLLTVTDAEAERFTVESATSTAAVVADVVVLVSLSSLGGTARYRSGVEECRAGVDVCRVGAGGVSIRERAGGCGFVTAVAAVAVPFALAGRFGGFKGCSRC